MSTIAAPSFNIASVIGIIFTKILDPIVTLVLRCFAASLLVVVVFAVYVIIRLHMNPFTRGYHKVIRLKRMELYFKPLNFLRWVYIDIITAESRKLRFKPFGLTLFCGRQGAGKSISMVEYANRMRARYPECIIVANFKYKHADRIMTSWHDLLNIRNGTKGVIFLIDEIHSEYSSEDWKNFPESLLSEISQQRKQRVKICASSQVFKRVVKQIREQSFTVVQCRTFADRWTFTREYDSIDYEFACDNPEKRKKLKALKHSFIQDDYLRGCYDTYQKIKRMKKIAEKPDGKNFIPRNQRAEKA